jgi:DNA modification methylase
VSERLATDAISRQRAPVRRAPAPTLPWRSRITGSGEEAPDQLLANPANWRIHPKAQQDALAGALDQVGWVGQVLVNQRSGFVVDGHARVALALTRREPTVPVLYVDLDPEEEALVLATLDPIGAMATADTAKLEELLAGITVDDAGLLALLGDLAGNDPKAGLTDPDEVPEPSEEPYVKTGDLWVLGEHRLLCGDSTKPQDVARLLDRAAPTLLVTDPPYGVSLDPTWRDGVYNGLGPAERPYMQLDGASVQSERDDATRSPGGAHKRTAGHRNTSISGDTRADWSEAFELVPSLEVAYVWCATTGMIEVGAGLERIGFELRQQIIWAKTQAAMSRSAYNWQHEPCWYAVRKGKTASWRGRHSDTTLWEMASPKMIMGGSTEQKYDHPTQKPVEAMSRAIGHHAGDVYEPFSGSGTTLIAAEQLGRRCYAIEIDPKYVQVALERWQNFTGAKAVLLG